MRPLHPILRISPICLIITLLSACIGSVATPSPSEVETVVALTFAAITGADPTTSPEAAPSAGVITFTAIPSPTSGSIPSNPPTILNVQTAVQNVNLRVGPGTLFQVSRVLAQGTMLEAHGRSRGGEWLYVKNAEGIFGWVLVQLVTISRHDGPPLPEVDPPNSYLVSGVVITDNAASVSGIGFAITQGFSSNAPRTDATSDEEGHFFAYLPATLTGTWNVRFVSVACTSNTMDANCNCKSGICGKAQPETVEITLPLSKELIFIWK
ncbi:MAG TPA: SH3 domain-containing protein [Anaerolineales bacterium]|nr:SH3 domain-containing protein [Anaerolineales bacterium]